MKIAINGFGRIGRNFLRALLADSEASELISVVAINNGSGNPEALVHLFKYDTLLGTYAGSVQLDNDYMVIDGHRIKIITELDPAAISWSMYEVSWVVEASGHFTHKKDAYKHIMSGAEYVLITAPAENEDVAIVPGVNEDVFDSAHHKIVSLGSCTTNALVPIVKILHDAFTLTSGMMTTVHAYTNTQVLLDVETSDMRRSRAAALNIIPTSTGASDVLTKILPELDGVIKSMALRVPVAKVSIIDFSFTAQKSFTIDTIHEAIEQAGNQRMQGIVDITYEPLVSSDFNKTHYSVVIDGLLTDVNRSMGKLFGWYDNEWGYSMRLKDFLVYISQK